MARLLGLFRLRIVNHLMRKTVRILIKKNRQLMNQVLKKCNPHAS